MKPTVEMIINRPNVSLTPMGRSKYFQRHARKRCTGAIDRA